MMKQIDCLLSVGDGQRDRSCERDDVVDVHREPNPKTAKMSNRRGQHLCGQSWGWSQAEGHPDALVLHSLPHEPHGLAVPAANEEVMIKVADVDLGHVVVATEELGHRV